MRPLDFCRLLSSSLIVKHRCQAVIILALTKKKKDNGKLKQLAIITD